MGESTYGEMQYIEKRILRLRFSVIRGRNGVLCVLFAGGTATEATGHFVAFRGRLCGAVTKWPVTVVL